MSNYVQTTIFTPKDSLPTTDPNKTIFGAAYDVEFGNISTAIASKVDTSSNATLLSLNVTGASVPANGIYLSAANTLTFAANTTKEGAIGGGMILGAPTGGAKGLGTLNATALYINGTALGTVTGFATPTGTATLVASAGAATTAIRSDANIAIDVTIAPTWSGIHTWTLTGSDTIVLNSTNANGVISRWQNSATSIGFIGSSKLITGGTLADFCIDNGGSASTNLILSTHGTVRGQISGAGAWTINHPASTNIDVNASELPGIQMRSTGVNAVKIAMRAYDAGAEGLIGTLTNHPMNLRTNDADRITISAAGVVAVLAPTSGVAFTVTGTGVSTAVQINAGAVSNGVVYDNTQANGGYIRFTNSGTAAGFIGTGPSVITGSALADFCLASNTGNLRLSAAGGVSNITISQAGNVTIAAPTSNNSLTVTAAANAYGTRVIAPNTASQSLGLYIQAGTNSSDFSFNINNAANALTYFQVRGDGVLLGNGPVAAALVDMTPDKGTFTCTFVGGTTAPTGTATWTRMGNHVTLSLPLLTATSNASTFGYSGLPAALQPATLDQLVWPGSGFEDNSASANGAVHIVHASGTISFSKLNGLNYSDSAWTAAGAKGLATGNSAQFTFSYMLQ